MKIFVDTAVLDEIEDAYEAGIADGVTTNPSLMKEAIEELEEKGAKITLDSYIKKILRIARGTPVSLEVTAFDYAGMVEQGKRIFKKYNSVAGNVYVKIPVNPSFIKDSDEIFDGIRAIRELTKSRIPVNCTLIFTPEQALFAAKAGAKFVSPFEGREEDYIRKKFRLRFKKTDYYPMEGKKRRRKSLDDRGIVSGYDLIYQIKSLFSLHDIKSEILAASIRSPQQLREAGLAGADIVTAPFSVIKECLHHEKTIEGMKTFTADVEPEYKKLVEK